MKAVNEIIYSINERPLCSALINERLKTFHLMASLCGLSTIHMDASVCIHQIYPIWIQLFGAQESGYP